MILRKYRPILRRSAIDNLFVRCGGRKDFIDPDNVMTERSKLHRTRGDVHVGKKPHSRARVFSLASQAPYLAA